MKNNKALLILMLIFIAACFICTKAKSQIYDIDSIKIVFWETGKTEELSHVNISSDSLITIEFTQPLDTMSLSLQPDNRISLGDTTGNKKILYAQFPGYTGGDTLNVEKEINVDLKPGYYSLTIQTKRVNSGYSKISWSLWVHVVIGDSKKVPPMQVIRLRIKL